MNFNDMEEIRRSMRRSLAIQHALATASVGALLFFFLVVTL